MTSLEVRWIVLMWNFLGLFVLVCKQVGSGVADLEERLLPTPEVRSSNPVIGKIFCTTCTYYLSTVE